MEYDLSRPLKLEGKVIRPAAVEGNKNVFKREPFLLSRSRWVEDDQATCCPLCLQKFNQIRRRHHCRQCGRVLCSKCCHEKIPLPQLSLEEPERVCEDCRPITELVTCARSMQIEFQRKAARGLAEFCQNLSSISKVVELGGVQTLIYLGSKYDKEVQSCVASGVHSLCMHAPLLNLLATSGAIKAICHLLEDSVKQETSHSEISQLQIDGISSLMIFCKSESLKTQALKDGALRPILALCNLQEAVALLAIRTLTLILERRENLEMVLDNTSNTVQSIIALMKSRDEQMQEAALKVLCYLSLGTKWHRHLIIQEDYTSGKHLAEILTSKPKNRQVLCNAACLAANLATSVDDQASLQEILSCMCDLLLCEPHESEVQVHTSRAIANFASCRGNSGKLMYYLPNIVDTYVKSQNETIRNNGIRAILLLLQHDPGETTRLLLTDGAAEVLTSLPKIPGLLDSVASTILAISPNIIRPS